jgi:threonine/homoserine/homoserine lactone efflux protein
LIAAMWTTSALFWAFFVRAVAAGSLRALLERWRVAIERAFGAVLVALGVRVAISD